MTQRKWLGLFVIATIFLIVAVAFLRNSTGSSQPHVAPSNPDANANDGLVASSTGQSDKPPDFDKAVVDNELAKSAQALTAALQQLEVDRARVFWSGDIGQGRLRLSAIAITAPDESDLGKISKATSDAVAAVNLNARDKARINLQKIYDEYARYRKRKPYRIVYVWQNLKSHEVTEVTVTDTSDIEGSTPRDTGGITYRGDHTTGNGDWWKPRYEKIVGLLTK